MISIEIENLAHVMNKFKDIQNRAKNPSTAMEICAAKGWRDVIGHFSATEGPDGKWDPLKPATILSRKHGGTKPLQDTGLLRQSNRYRVLKAEAHVYNDAKYAGVHNYGYAKKNIPKRQFMWLSNKAKLAIIKTIKRYIVMGTAEFGS